MKRTELSRRDFARLTAAAFGGVVAGSMAGCGRSADTDTAGGGAAPPAEGDAATGGAADTATGAGAATEEVSLLIQEPHICRGLNTCEGKGKSGDNACAGQGTCASVEHTCAGQNDCKGQGGCGGEHGTNACKGQGGCAVPLEHGWEAVRKKFEEAMQKAGKTFGDAPAA